MKNIFIRNATKGYNYSYASLEDITKKLNEQEIYYNQTIEVIDGKEYIKTFLYDKDGNKTDEGLGCRIVCPEMKSGNSAQSYGAGISYARRYSLLMFLGIATVDDESKFMNYEEGSKLTKNQKEKIEMLIAEHHLNMGDVKKHLDKVKCKKITDLSNEQADKYLKFLEKLEDKNE